MCLGSLSIWRPICEQALTSRLMSWDVASIYPHHFPFFFLMMTSILWSAPVRLSAKHPPQRDAVTTVLHGRDSILRLASFNLFLIITAKHFVSDQRTIKKKQALCPHVQLQTVVWLFYGSFRAVASSQLSGISCSFHIQLLLQKLLKPWHDFQEFPNLFKSTINLAYVGRQLVHH